MADIYTYRPKELVNLANGITLSGFADDSMVEVVPEEEDEFTATTGSDGNTIRTESSNNNYVLTYRFQQGSNSAKMLFALKGAVFVLLVQDPADSDEVIVSPASYVMNKPSGKRGKVAHQDTKVKIMLVDPTIMNLL